MGAGWEWGETGWVGLGWAKVSAMGVNGSGWVGRGWAERGGWGDKEFEVTEVSADDLFHKRFSHR